MLWCHLGRDCNRDENLRPASTQRPSESQRPATAQVTDDYQSERKQVMAKSKRNLSRTAWLAKAVLGGKLQKVMSCGYSHTGHPHLRGGTRVPTRATCSWCEKSAGELGE